MDTFYGDYYYEKSEEKQGLEAYIKDEEERIKLKWKKKSEKKKVNGEKNEKM